MSAHRMLFDQMQTLHPHGAHHIQPSPLVCLTERQQQSGCYETVSDFGSSSSAVSAESSSVDRYSDDGWNVLSPAITPPATPSAAAFASAMSSCQHSPISSSTAQFLASPTPGRETYHRSHMHSPAFDTPGPLPPHQQLKWRSYPPPLLTEALGIDFLKACTEHLPLDAGHWTLLKQLVASGQVKILSYILKNCLRHENPCELQSRPQNAVRNVGGYLTKVIRQKTQLFQRRPDIVAMMDDLCVSSPAMAAQMDGRILQLLSESIHNPEGMAACQSIIALPPAANRGSMGHYHHYQGQQQMQQQQQQYHSPAALQRDLKCYVDHASWVETLLGPNGQPQQQHPQHHQQHYQQHHQQQQQHW